VGVTEKSKIRLDDVLKKFQFDNQLQGTVPIFMLNPNPTSVFHSGR